MPAPIRPGRRENDEKQFQSGEVKSFSRTLLLATSISLLLAYFSLVFPVPAPPSVYLGPLARTSLPLPDVPFSSTYCANSSNVATTAILDGHSASEERKRVRRRTEEPESGKNKLGEDEPESKRGAARKLN